MTEPIKLTIDGVEIEAKPGQTVLQAAIDEQRVHPLPLLLARLEALRRVPDVLRRG